MHHLIQAQSWNQLELYCLQIWSALVYCQGLDPTLTAVTVMVVPNLIVSSLFHHHMIFWAALQNILNLQNSSNHKLNEWLFFVPIDCLNLETISPVFLKDSLIFKIMNSMELWAFLYTHLCIQIIFKWSQFLLCLSVVRFRELKCAANGLTIIVITLLSGIFFLAVGILCGRVWYFSSSFPQVIESAVHWFSYLSLGTFTTLRVLRGRHWEKYKCSVSFNCIISKIEACPCRLVLPERHNVLTKSRLLKVARGYNFRNECGLKLTPVGKHCIPFVILICLLKITHYWAAYRTH